MSSSLPTTTLARKPWSTLQVSISQEAFWGWRRLEDMQLKALLAVSGIEAFMVVMKHHYQAVTLPRASASCSTLVVAAVAGHLSPAPTRALLSTDYFCYWKTQEKKWKTSAVLAAIRSRNTGKGSGAGSVLDFPHGTLCPHLRPKFGRGESECGWW